MKINANFSLRQLHRSLLWFMVLIFLSIALIFSYHSAQAQTKKSTSSAQQKNSKSQKNKTKKTKPAPALKRAAYSPSAVPSYGQQLGLHHIDDPLDLSSSVAYVVDQSSGEVLFEKNSSVVLPIASITKLMTALVVLDSGLLKDEILEINEFDADLEKGTHSRLKFGTLLSREDALHLALMASENRAASALGRNYPGGITAFVQAMNAKAKLLGMDDTRYVDSSGLSSLNQSSARDLARLVHVAYQYPLIREFSTSTAHAVVVGDRFSEFGTTNRLIKDETWSIGLQKTGFTSEAGQCLVMQASINERPVILVLLDAKGKLSRFGDANRIRSWMNHWNTARPRNISLLKKPYGPS